MSDDETTPDAAHPAERALADARAQGAAAQARGSSYGVALQHIRAAHALLALDRPGEALTDLTEAARYVEMLRTDGEHERMRLLSISSLSLAPPDAELGDLDTLDAWIRVGYAGTLVRLGRLAEARTAIADARPWTKGWRRRDLRRALDTVADELARAEGTGQQAISAAGRAAHDPRLSQADRLQARYEHAALLADDGRYDEAMREALHLLRDIEDPALEARVRQVLGAALAGLGRSDDATTSLQAAFDGFRATGDTAAVVAAAPGLAWRLTHGGNASAALGVLDAGLAAARSRGDAVAQADLLTAVGTTRDAAGDVTGAVAAFNEAIALAERAGDDVRAADARHGEAVVRGHHVDPADPDDAIDALALLDAARSAYEAAGLAERAAGCVHESAAILGRLGSYEAAVTRYQAAREAYGQVPDVLRDGGSGALADCQRNLAVLASLTADRSSPVPSDAFASGGHDMSFGRPPGAAGAP